MSEYVLTQVLESRRHSQRAQELLRPTYPEIAVEPSETPGLGPIDITFIVSLGGKKRKLVVPDTLFMEQKASDRLVEALRNQLPTLLT